MVTVSGLSIESARSRPLPGLAERAAALAAMTQHPAMPEALRILFTAINALNRGNRLINLMMSDRARIMMGWLTLFLDAGYDPRDPLSGLTVNRYKALCAETGLSSPGRGAGTLGFMRFAGYLEPATPAARGLPLRLVPTEKLIAPLRARLKFGLTALAHLRPEGAIGLARLNDPVFFKRLLRGVGEQFLDREHLIDHAPTLAFFAERKGGLLILMALMLSAQPNDPLPPSGPMAVSVKELARRSVVARAQVRDLLRGGVEAGLMTFDATEGAYRMTPKLQVGVVNFIAAVLLLLADAVTRAHEELASDPNSATC
ncbi:MAG TPA: hypothetical protein VG986_13510 [Pseudolabrys sp.]|nr:hypothetical protein [Pseudolabrys sp.]